MQRIRTLLIALMLTIASAGLIVPAPPVYAQVAVVEVEPARKPTPFKLDLGYGHLFNTDIDSGGDFQRNGFRASFGAEFGLAPRLKLDNVFAYEYHNYTFSGTSAFQWNDIHLIQYIPLLKWVESERWQFLGGPIVKANAEEGADFSDAITGGGIVGFNYVRSPTLSIGLLIGALSQIEDDALVAPIPVIRWKFAEQWLLRTGVSQLGSLSGLGGEVAWQAVKNLELAAGAQFQRERFRLDRNDRVAQETSVPLYGKVSWWMFPQGRLEVFAGIAAGGELRLETKNGDKIREEDYDETANIGVRIDITF